MQRGLERRRKSILGRDETSEPSDKTAEATATLTECVSVKSTSVKPNVPVGTGLDVSSDVEPVTFACSAAVADPGPLVIVGASLAPVTTTDTVCVALVEASLTLTL